MPYPNRTKFTVELTFMQERSHFKFELQSLLLEELIIIKRTYNLSDCVISWAHCFKGLKDYNEIFTSYCTAVCYWSLKCKLHRPIYRLSKKKVMSCQTQKSRKAIISPFLSDQSLISFSHLQILIVVSGCK